MTDLLSLVESESDDSELIPTILPVDANLSIYGSVTEFLEKLQSAVAVTPTKEILPGSVYVMVQAVDSTTEDKSRVVISATDGERSVERVIRNISVALAGSSVLPGRKLVDILKLASEPVFRLDVFASTATVRSGRAVWTIQLPTTKGIPQLPDSSTIPTHEVNKLELVKALEVAAIASAKSTARMSLNQVKLDKRAVVGCDGARMHKKALLSAPKNFSTSIPTSFLETMLKELKSFKQETIFIGSNSHTVVIRLGEDTFTGQRLTLDYPNVDHLMLEPSMLNTEHLKFSIPEAIDAIKRVRVNADPDLATIVLGIRVIKGQWTLTIRAIDRTGNSSQETISAEYDGEASREIAVNHRYLMEFLWSISEDEAVFRLGEDTKSKKAPIYVETDTFTGVLMPTTNAFVK